MSIPPTVRNDAPEGTSYKTGVLLTAGEHDELIKIATLRPVNGETLHQSMLKLVTSPMPG